MQQHSRPGLVSGAPLGSPSPELPTETPGALRRRHYCRRAKGTRNLCLYPKHATTEPASFVATRPDRAESFGHVSAPRLVVWSVIHGG